MRKIMVFFISIFVIILSSGCDGMNEAQTSYKPTGTYQANTRYVIGVNAYLSSKEMFIAYRPIVDYLERHMNGIKFELATSKNFVEYEKRLNKSEFHFALSNPYQSLVSFDHHYYPIAKMKNDDEFRGLFIARKDSHLRHYRQLNGKVISFAAPTAFAGTVMPKYYLWEQGIDVRHDMVVRYVGSHFSAIMNVYSGDSFVAGTWPLAWEQWKKNNPDKASEMEVVWRTKSLMNNALVARSDVPVAVVQKVTQLLLQLDSTQEGQELLKQAGFEGFEVADRQTFAPVEEFLNRYNNTLGKIQ
ncbi:MAG: phosphate/phosphite/phosphonate ABC transporter substrate-binding protein [Sulfuricurvum sp.]